ncbi:MAG: hypothetical protein C4519_11310 [Desulfobacteraceae bacterium]|nr:MAG: hypothetical protein C4519_11310 [Desulfobacteraceae bacterium]
MTEYLKIIVPSLIGLITTVTATFFTARWAVNRAFQERWWARKEQVYSEIIEALHDLLRYSSFEANQYRNNYRGEHPKEKEFAARYSEAYWKVQKMTDLGPFVISEEAAEILHRLRERPKLDFEYDDPLDIRDQETKHYREALDGIRRYARNDLKV